MPQRIESPRSLSPSPTFVRGHRWELIEPMLRHREGTRRNSDSIPGCWSMVKDVGTVQTQWGEQLRWTIIGNSIFGSYETHYEARRGRCEKCKTEAADLYPGARTLRERFCVHCLLDHKRAFDRLAARKRRRRNGQVTTPEQLSCHHCGTAFKPQRSTAKYCSSACRVAAHRAQKAL